MRGLKTGGRTKGSKNLATVAKTRALLVADGVLARSVTSPRPLRTKAQAGIDPKDLLLSAMRDCWSNANKLEHEALACRTEAEKFPVVDLVAMPGGKLDPRSALLERARFLSLAAQAQVDRATGLARDSAPYVHAKLANIEQRFVGHIKVVLPKY